MKATIDNIKLICEGLDHPEGVAFDLEGNMYAGGEAGQFYRINVSNGEFDYIGQSNGFMLGITLDGNGNVYACDSERKEILRCSPEGKIDIYATGTTQRPFVNPNYSVFDSQGRLFFTDSGDYYKPSGSIWVVEPGKAAEPLTEPNLPFANGLSLDSENQFLYVVLSTSSSIGRFKLDGKDLVGQMEIVVELEKGTVPDGIALDSSRNIWLGCYALDEIWKIKPNGQIEKVMEDKTGELLNRPTNIALQKDKIFFANLGGWHIGSFEAKVEPLALNYPELL